MNKEAVIQCQNVGKTYDDGSLKVEVLRNINFQVASVIHPRLPEH